jgi:CheY-like chemotaxis protein
MIGRGASELFRGIPRGIRVLCVDDESMIGNMVAGILRDNLEMRVEVARNGLEALDALQGGDFELLIIDYVMPEMDGGQLYRELERLRPEIVPRVLFITGDTLSESTLGFIASTGRRLLEKPFGLPDLTGAIREILLAEANRPRDG